MHVDIRSHQLRSALFALLAVLTLLLSTPPAARADHGQQPEAYCPFTGVKTLVLRPGGKFPLPNKFENLTGLSWTFYYILIREDFPFGLSGDPLTATLGGSLTLPPYTAVYFPPLDYTLPLSTRAGTGRVTYWVFANSSGPITRIVNPAKCEYDLTVKPLFAAFDDTEEPSPDH